MPGAGTDKTKEWEERPGPVIVLVEPQLGENIGAAARAMANFGLSRLRLVAPRQRWPNDKARMMAAGADRILDGAALFDSLEQAIADCTFVVAATARAHDQAKPVVSAPEAAALMAPQVAAGETVAVVFGRERNGLENDEIALADRILTLPVNPAFASLNLAQAVVIVAYEWSKLAGGGHLPFAMPEKSAPAPKEQLYAFFASLERELEKVEFFRPPDKRDTMQINLRNIFTRMQPTQQDIQTLHGVIMAIAEGRKGPARGRAGRRPPRAGAGFGGEPAEARGPRVAVAQNHRHEAVASDAAGDVNRNVAAIDQNAVGDAHRIAIARDAVAFGRHDGDAPQAVVTRHRKTCRRRKGERTGKERGGAHADPVPNAVH